MTEIRVFLENVKNNGYTISQIYTSGVEIKFIRILTPSQRKPFLLQFPDNMFSYTKSDSIKLTQTDHNYRNYRQRSYLEKFNLPSLACTSRESLCLKNGDVLTCYINEVDESDPDELDSDISGFGDSEIEVDDYPIENIYPVFQITKDSNGLDGDFETDVIENYHIISSVEEEMNEIEVENLLYCFDKQKKNLKDNIFEIHKRIYHLRRDLEQASENLERIYMLREKTVHEKDRIRFKVDRMAIEAENKIDHFNKKLCDYRNKADKLLTEYKKYINRFNYISS